MTRSLLILLAGLVVGTAAYACFFLMGTAESRQRMQSAQPELQWLKEEFDLGDEEFSRIVSLHEAYLPRCADRCAKIEAMNEQLDKALAEATEITPQIEALLQERAQIRALCQKEMLQHFFEVSRAMPVEQGGRYLAWAREMTCLRETLMPGHEMPNHSRNN